MYVCLHVAMFVCMHVCIYVLDEKKGKLFNCIACCWRVYSLCQAMRSRRSCHSSIAKHTHIRTRIGIYIYAYIYILVGVGEYTDSAAEHLYAPEVFKLYVRVYVCVHIGVVYFL